MKVSELRVGNYIANGIVEKGGAILNGYYKVKTEDFPKFSQNDEHLNGILLDEEWLLMMGFERYDGMYVIQKYFTYLKNTGSGWYLTDCDDNAISVKIESVHQLQNLIYALTGEELTIKETTK